MQYIVHRRFKDKGITGDVNIPALSICEEEDGIIIFDGKPVCYITSENGHQFFARNDDLQGLVRGRLTQEIQRVLGKRDANYQARWDRVWNDPVCRRYKRTEQDDFWLWNHEFFGADIEVLKHISKLVNAKEV